MQTQRPFDLGYSREQIAEPSKPERRPFPVKVARNSPPNGLLGNLAQFFSGARRSGAS